MTAIRACVVGYGNVGKEAVLCIRQAPDMELVGVISRTQKSEEIGAPVFPSVDKIPLVDVAILSIPSRVVPSYAPLFLKKGINTVDSFDIHGDSMAAHKEELSRWAHESGRVAVLGAGWDPGVDSVARALFLAMTPRGVTYTNFGPGMSMGHTVVAKSIPGVKNALSMTLPAQFGQHKRDVYVELEDGADFSKIESAIKKDPYFKDDETRVNRVSDVKRFESKAHGVVLQRYGSAGSSENQLLEWRLRLSNPSCTAQIMTAAARASTKMESGAYTLIEIPPINLLPGDPETILKSLA